MVSDARKSLSVQLIKRGVGSLRRIPFLTECKESVLQVLVEKLSMRFGAPGEVLARQGEECTQIMMLGKGEVEIMTDGVQVGEIGNGSVIGDPKSLLGMSSAARWEHTVTTGTFCDFMVLTAKDFMEVIGFHPAEQKRIALLVPPPEALQKGSQSIQMEEGSSDGLSRRLSLNSRSVQALGKFLRRARCNLSTSPTSSRDKKQEAVSLQKRVSVARVSGQQRNHHATAESTLDGGSALVNTRSQTTRNSVKVVGGQDLNVKSEAAIEDEREELCAFVGEIDFFSNIDSFSFDHLVGSFQRKRWKRKQELLSEGKAAVAVHVIHVGSVAVSIGGKVVSKLGPKAILGERSVVNNVSSTGDEQVHCMCSATVTVVSAVAESYTLTRDCLIQLFQRDETMRDHFNASLELEKVRGGRTGFKNMKIFQRADPNFTAALEVKTYESVLDVGEILLRQGEETSKAVLLCRGSVDIMKDDKLVSSVSVTEMKDAVIFGEFVILGLWKAHKATIVATTQCRVNSFSAKTLRTCLEDFPDDSIILRGLVEARAAKQQKLEVAETKQNFIDTPSGCLDEDRGDINDKGETPDAAADGKVKGEAPGSAADGEVNNVGKARETATDGEVNDVGEAPETATDGSYFDGSHHDEDFGSDQAGSIWEGDSDDEDVRRRTGYIETERFVLPGGLAGINEFAELPDQVLDELEMHMKKRLYLPEQVILRQGSDMSDVFILQKGSCGVEIFGAELQPTKGPAVIGGMPSLLTKKVFTTVIALETCFVVKISKRRFASIFDRFHHARKMLFAHANKAFQKLCDTFQDNMLDKQGLHRSLATIPFLSRASHSFLDHLAEAVEPRLFLPGQDIVTFRQKSQEELYFVFEGHFQILKNGVTTGTVSPKTVYGVLEVFGIKDLDRSARIKSDEVCKVGALSRDGLNRLLSTFPEERIRFERLVHNLMEHAVSDRLLNLNFFKGMHTGFLSQVGVLFERRFFMPKMIIVRERDVGDSMLVLNSGKIDLIYHGVDIGALWLGKTFGCSQMMCVHKEYHASLQTISTCHMIILGWKSLSTLVIQASDREWVQELKDRALEIYTLELRLFARKSRRVRLMAKSGVTQHMLSTISDEYALMSRILDCWRSLTFRDREDDREENARSKRGARSAARSDARDRHAQTEKTSLVDASLSLRIETRDRKSVV